jgi:hypothetical protein
MAGVPGQDPIIQSKSKAVSALLPYAVCLAQGGQQGMMEAILRVALKSTSGGFAWRQIGLYITPWFDESSPPPPDQAITLVSPCANWERWPYTESSVARWAGQCRKPHIQRRLVSVWLMRCYKSPTMAPCGHTFPLKFGHG